MAKNLVFEKTTSLKLKAVGTLDFEKGVIIVDGEEKKLSTLFADFNNMETELTMQIKDKEEFDIPENDSDEV